MNSIKKEQKKHIATVIVPRLDVLDLIMKNGGVIEFAKPLFASTWEISKIKAVFFNEEWNGEEEGGIKNLNAYVGRVYSAIGVNSYCELVRNKEGDMVGILALYNHKGEEIKTKYFKKWKSLLEKIEKSIKNDKKRSR